MITNMTDLPITQILAIFLAIIGLILVAIGAYTEQKADYLKHRSNTVKRQQKRSDLLLLLGLLLITIGVCIL